MEDNDEILRIWASLPKDIQKTLRKAAEESSAITEKQFIAEIMIGECLHCGGSADREGGLNRHRVRSGFVLHASI
jgi:hypothetical protein